MPIGISEPGFLLVDPMLAPLACNAEAVQILTFPNVPEKIKRLDVFLSDKIRAGLVDRQSQQSLDFVKEFKSGRRRYICRTFRLDCNNNGHHHSEKKPDANIQSINILIMLCC